MKKFKKGRTEPSLNIAAVEVVGDDVAAVEVEGEALSAEKAFKVGRECGGKFDNRSFKRHQLSHKEASFKCHTCGKNFTLAASLKRHRDGRCPK